MIFEIGVVVWYLSSNISTKGDGMERIEVAVKKTITIESLWRRVFRSLPPEQKNFVEDVATKAGKKPHQVLVFDRVTMASCGLRLLVNDGGLKREVPGVVIVIPYPAAEAVVYAPDGTIRLHKAIPNILRSSHIEREANSLRKSGQDWNEIAVRTFCSATAQI